MRLIRLGKSALRYLRLLAGLVAMQGKIPHPIHLCLTVDFDAWPGDSIEPAFHILEKMYARFGLTGKITYLINPRYDLGDRHPIYREIFEKGYEIGLHTHAEKLMLQGHEDEIYALIVQEKALVEQRFRCFDPAFEARSFRSGSRSFSTPLFHALTRAGIRYDSSLGHHPRVREVYEFRVEDGCEANRVYYLQPDAYRSEPPFPTPLVEIPVSGQLPDLRALAAALRPGEPLVVATFIHPFNFHRGGKPNRLFHAYYSAVLFCLQWIRNAQFSHLSEAGEAWENWYKTSGR
jgi:hypothetical protein